MIKHVRLALDEGADVVRGTCRNISIGGMLVHTDDPRPQGSLVRFELEIDEQVTINGLGEVIWMRARDGGPGREPGMGIKFRFIEQRDRQVIYKLVSDHIKERLAQKHPGLEELSLVDERSPAKPAAAEPAAAPPAPAEPSPAPPAPVEPVASRPPEEIPILRIPDFEAPDLEAPDLEAPDLEAPDLRAPEFEAPDMFPESFAEPEEPTPPEEPAGGEMLTSLDELDEIAVGEPASSVAEDSWLLEDEPAERGPAERGPAERGPAERGPAERKPRPDLGYDEPLPPLDEVAGPAPTALSDLPPAAGPPAVGPPAADLTSSDLPTYPDDAEPGVEGPGEHEPRYDAGGLYHPRPARRRDFPVVTVVLLLILVGVVAVYLNWDRLFGSSAPPAGPPVAEELAAGGLEGSITPVSEDSREAPPAEAPERPAEARPAEARPVEAPSPQATERPAAPPSPAAAVPEFKRVVDISWTRRPGGIKVEIETDGMIPQGRYSYFRLEGEKPREVVRLKDVVERYPQSEIKVSGAPVGRIRVGYHANRELHVVLDMLDRSSRLTSVRTRGTKLEIVIE